MEYVKYDWILHIKQLRFKNWMKKEKIWTTFKVTVPVWWRENLF